MIDMHGSLYKFIFPDVTRGLLLRIAIIIVGSYIFFGHICLPIRIKGTSMEPTYHDGRLNFCWRPAFLLRDPVPGEIIVIRFVGRKLALLKRVIGVAGDVIEFKDGRLFRNGEPVYEPYVVKGSDWNMPPRAINQGGFYVVGDNRSMEIEKHMFGEVQQERIMGAPVW